MCFPELGRFPCGRCFSDSQNLLLKLRVYRQLQGRVVGSHTGYAPVMLLSVLGQGGPRGGLGKAVGCLRAPRGGECPCLPPLGVCSSPVCLRVNGSVSVPISSNQWLI